MKELKHSVTGRLLLALLLTLFLPLGVFGIIYGASAGIKPVLIVGIIAAVVGFYGCPMSWIAYAGRKRLVVILNLIVNENVYSIEEMAAHLSVKPEQITTDVNTLIINGYLKGYLFKDGFLVLNTNRKQQKSDGIKKECPNCGGRMEYNGVNYVCEYCGYVEQNEKLKS